MARRTRAARFDFARKFGKLLLILLRPGAHGFQHGVDLLLWHNRYRTRSAHAQLSPAAAARISPWRVLKDGNARLRRAMDARERA